MIVDHYADTHFGFRAYRKTTPTGVNQREHDVATALRRCLQHSREGKPDLILFAGDLFHASRPPNAVVIEAYRRMREFALIAPVIIGGGNHDSPRTAEAGNILHLFSEIPNVRVVVDEPEIVTSEDFGIDDCSPWAVLVIPHHGEKAGTELIDRADTVSKMAGRKKILLLHAALEGEGENLYGGHGLPVEVLRPARWHYIAAGDYHVRTRLTENGWYPGSMEYVSTNPWEESKGPPKGFIRANLGTNETEVIESDARKVVDLDFLDAAGMDAEQVMAKIREAIPPNPNGLIIRQVVLNIPKTLSRELDWAFVREIRSRATHFQLDLRSPDKVAGAESIGELKGVPLVDLVRAFVEKDFDSTPGVDKVLVAEAAVSAFQSLAD